MLDRDSECPATGFLVRALPAPFGAEVIGLDLRGTIEPNEQIRLRQAWAQHSLLILRQEDLTDEDIDRFALIFGQLERRGIEDDSPTAHRHFISNVLPGHEIVGNGELGFHMGYPFVEHPPRGTILYGCVVPPPSNGGDTLFANAKLAYDSLPSSLRETIGPLQILYKSQFDETASWAHPIAFAHPLTGETVLFVDAHLSQPRFFAGVLGLSRQAGQLLCDELVTYLKRPSVTYRHAWTRGDVVLWDNLKLQHARTHFDPGFARHLMRRQIGRFEPSPKDII